MFFESYHNLYRSGYMHSLISVHLLLYLVLPLLPYPDKVLTYRTKNAQKWPNQPSSHKSGQNLLTGLSLKTYDSYNTRKTRLEYTHNHNRRQNFHKLHVLDMPNEICIHYSQCMNRPSELNNLWGIHNERTHLHSYKQLHLHNYSHGFRLHIHLCPDIYRIHLISCQTRISSSLLAG